MVIDGTIERIMCIIWHSYRNDWVCARCELYQVQAWIEDKCLMDDYGKIFAIDILVLYIQDKSHIHTMYYVGYYIFKWAQHIHMYLESNRNWDDGMYGKWS